MREGLLDEVRARCADVATQATSVRIDEERLAAYATEIDPAEAQAHALDPTYSYVGDPAPTLAWVLTFNAVNFGSGWFPHVRKVPGRSGSITMMTRLTERFRADGPFTADELAALTPGDCAAVFDQPIEPPVDELMAHFATGLNDLGRLLLDRYGGSFTALVEEADHSAERLAGLLLAMPLFRDVASYRGFSVPLLKRAQLTGADLALALAHDGLGRFGDLDRLTIFADNLVPHVLRIEGVLRFEPELVDRIEREEVLEPGGEEEVEIRAVALHAVERIVEALDHRVTPMGLDYVLWTSGQDPRYKAVPRHRARSVYY